MESLQTIAVAKAIKDKASKAASKDIEPGRYDVDLIVRVLGSFSKGEDFQQNLTAKINWQLGLALALSKVNKETRDSIIADMLAAMSNGGESDEHKALAAQIKAEIQPKLDELKGETKTTMSGKVTTDLTAEVVGSANINKVG
jgi:hypothetical protein